MYVVDGITEEKNISDPLRKNRRKVPIEVSYSMRVRVELREGKFVRRYAGVR